MLSNGSVTAESTPSIYELLNWHFAKFFSNSNQDMTYHSPEPIPPPPELSNISSKDEVLHLLSSITRKTSSGTDGISSAMLRNTAIAIALIDLCHLGRSHQTGIFQISHPYQKVVTPNLSQIIAPYHSCHCLQKFLNILSSTSFCFIYFQIPFFPTLSLVSIIVVPPSLQPQTAGINIWMRGRLLELSSLTSEKLLIRFPIRISSEHLLKLVSQAHCTPGLLTIYLVTCRVLSLSINHKTIKIGWWALARDNTVLGSFYAVKFHSGDYAGISFLMLLQNFQQAFTDQLQDLLYVLSPLFQSYQSSYHYAWSTTRHV